MLRRRDIDKDVDEGEKKKMYMRRRRRRREMKENENDNTKSYKAWTEYSVGTHLSDVVWSLLVLSVKGQGRRVAFEHLLAG